MAWLRLAQQPTHAARVARVIDWLRRASAGEDPVANFSSAVDDLYALHEADDAVQLTAPEYEAARELIKGAIAAVALASPELAPVVAAGAGGLQERLRVLAGFDGLMPEDSSQAELELNDRERGIAHTEAFIMKHALQLVSLETGLARIRQRALKAVGATVQDGDASHRSRLQAAEFIFAEARRQNIRPDAATTVKLLEGAVFLLRQELSVRGMAAPAPRARA